jgi:hypothetical protein
MDQSTHSQSFCNPSIFTELSSESFLNLFIFTFSFWNYSLQISACTNKVVCCAKKIGAMCTRVCDII